VHSVETARGGEWQLHGAHGCGGLVDRQFSILDLGFSSSNSWWRRRMMVGGCAWNEAAEYSGTA